MQKLLTVSECSVASSDMSDVENVFILSPLEFSELKMSLQIVLYFIDIIPYFLFPSIFFLFFDSEVLIYKPASLYSGFPVYHFWKGWILQASCHYISLHTLNENTWCYCFRLKFIINFTLFIFKEGSRSSEVELSLGRKFKPHYALHNNVFLSKARNGIHSFRLTRTCMCTNLVA